MFARAKSTISQFPALSRPAWKSYRVLLFVSQELNLLIGFSSAARVSSIASLRRAGVSQGACLRRFSFRATIAGALEVTIEMSAAARRPRGAGVWGGGLAKCHSMTEASTCARRRARCCRPPSKLGRRWDELPSKTPLIESFGAFGTKLHWMRQESEAAVMEGEGRSPHRAPAVHARPCRGPLRVQTAPLLVQMLSLRAEGTMQLRGFDHAGRCFAKSGTFSLRGFCHRVDYVSIIRIRTGVIFSAA